MTPQVSGSGVTVNTVTPDVAIPWRVKLKDPYFWANWTVVAAFIGFFTVFVILEPDKFLTAFNVNSILTAAAVPAILTLGQAFVIMTAGIDLSNAAVLTLGAVSFGVGFANGLPLIVCMLMAVVAGLIAGLVNGILVAVFKITDFIVTLGMLSLAGGVALVISDARPVQVIDPFLARLAINSIWVVPILMIIALVLLVIAQFVLTQTRFGTYVLATGGDKEVARAMGINVRRIKISVYAISGTLAGVAAILTVARIGSAEPAVNTTFLLNSVAAVVLGGVSLFGGRGNMIGPFVGAILLMMIVNGLTVAGVPQYYQYIAVGIIIFLSAALVRNAK
jgi:ribose/xylose/arabinose/galactoside ABC-type transport system permease subunit